MQPVTPGHRVLVKPDTLHEYDPVFQAAKKAGIELPEPDKRKLETGVDTGVVIELGPTAYRDFGGEPWCKVGDRISYVRHGGKFVVDPENKDRKWLIINDEDVCMVWKEDNDN